MADKPKPRVSTISIKVNGGEREGIHFPTEVTITLQKNSPSIKKTDEFVLYLFLEGNPLEIKQYPSGGHGKSLTGGILIRHEDEKEVYLFSSEYNFPTANGYYVNRFQKMTIHVPSAEKPEEKWQLIDFPDSRDNFQVSPLKPQ